MFLERFWDQTVHVLVESSMHGVIISCRLLQWLFCLDYVTYTNVSVMACEGTTNSWCVNVVGCMNVGYNRFLKCFRMKCHALCLFADTCSFSMPRLLNSNFLVCSSVLSITFSNFFLHDIISMISVLNLYYFRDTMQLSVLYSLLCYGNHS